MLDLSRSCPLYSLIRLLKIKANLTDYNGHSSLGLWNQEAEVIGKKIVVKSKGPRV